MVDGLGAGSGSESFVPGYVFGKKFCGGSTGFAGLLLMLTLLCCVMPVSGRTSARVRRERAREAAAKAAQAQKQTDQQQAEQKQEAIQPQPVASVAVPVAAPAAAAGVCDEACLQERQTRALQAEEQDLQRKLVWFSGGLVLVGLLQLGAMTLQGWLWRKTGNDVNRQAGWMETQAGMMRDQTEILRGAVAAAQSSAEAALKQISHAVVSERPWMEVQLAEKELNFSHLKFVAQNRGSSPAKVTMYAVEKVVVTTDDAVDGPRYGNHGRFDEVEWSQWRLSGDHFIVGEFQLPPTLSSEVQQPGVCVLYQGLIRYNDTLTEDVHETRFCYEAFAPEGGAVRFRMFPAKGYNAMT